MPSSPFLRFILTLTATLIGVLIAFKLDRKAEQQTRKETIIQHLRAIQRELNSNSNAIENNFQVINYLQGNGNDASHYALEPFSTSAWEAAVEDQLVEHIDNETYSDLQDLYTQLENVNELVRRLRTESLHPEMNQDSDTVWEDTWTISIAYWDETEEGIRETGLGDLIKNRSNQVNIKIDSVTTEIEGVIDSLEGNRQVVSPGQPTPYRMFG